jgi:polysaccharide pyruvyl transferase WcaK-like protein
MKQKKVLLLGSYGQSNLGDDLLMWNYLELLKSKGFNEIYVNANTTEFIPEVIKKAYPNLHIVTTYETSILDYIRLIKNVDCVVYGGGTLYKELYASTGRSPYSVIIRMMGFNIIAKLLRTKLYHLHIGIGSLKTKKGKWIAKLALGASTLTIFRDQKSYDFAKDTLHVSPQKIMKSTDGLFINHVWQSVWNKDDMQIDRKKYKRVVGVNVLSDIPDWIDRAQYINVMQRFVKTLLDDNVYVVFVPFQYTFNPRNDLVFTEEIFGDILKTRQNYTILSEATIDDISSYLQQCDLFVGMRFHSLLLSTVNTVPFVAVAYDTKCWRFINEVNYPHAIELEKLQYDDLMATYNKAFSSLPETKKQLTAITDTLYQEAEEGLRALNL